MINIETFGCQIDEISEQLQPEERARFKRQRETEHLKLLITGRQHLKLQALLIDNPDFISKKILRKKNTHGKADAQVLTGIKIIKREHAARETALIANAARKEAGITPSGSSSQAGESQYQTTITVALRPSSRRAPQALIQLAAPFPNDDIPEQALELPSSTAPSRLEQVQRQEQEGQAEEQAQGQAEEQEQGRGKRRKIAKKPFNHSTPR